VVDRIGHDFWHILDSVQVHCNIQSDIHLVKDHRYHKRMKHVNVRYHKICKWVIDDKVIDLMKINTKKNTADMMTQTIPVEKFRAPLNFIHVLQR